MDVQHGLLRVRGPVRRSRGATKRLNFLVFPAGDIAASFVVPRFCSRRPLFSSMQFRSSCICCAKLASRAKPSSGRIPTSLQSQHKSCRIMGCAVEAGGLVTASVT